MITGHSNERLREAYELLSSSNFVKATIAFKKLTRDYPRLVQGWFGYGCAVRASGQIELAEEIWRKAVDLAPRDGELLLRLGHQYEGIRRPDQAKRYYEAAAAANPGANQGAARECLGQLAYSIWRPPEHTMI